jgi:hypothetical protein
MNVKELSRTAEEISSHPDRVQLLLLADVIGSLTAANRERFEKWLRNPTSKSPSKKPLASTK